MEEPKVIFKPNQGHILGKGENAVATTIKKGRNKPEIWVWKPETFNTHIYEHEKHHAQNYHGNKDLKIGDYMKYEVDADRYANKKVYGKRDLTSEQAGRHISQYYDSLKRNVPKSQKDKLPSYMEFLKMGKSSNLFKDIGMSPKEIEKGLAVEMPRWNMTYDYNVKVKNYHTGEEREMVIASHSKTVEDAESNIHRAIERDKIIDGEKDWYVQKVNRLAKVAPNPIWGISGKRTNGKWASKKCSHKVSKCR